MAERYEPESSGGEGAAGGEPMVEPTGPGGAARASAPGAGARGRGELGGRLAGRTLPGQIWVLAVWPFMEQVLNSLVGFVDTALAGRLSVAATDAVGAVGFVMWLMGMLMMGVGVGSTALIARAIGGRHGRLANAAVGQSLLLAATWGSAVGVGLSLGAEEVARFFNLRGEALEYGTMFTRMLGVASPLAAILFVGGACLRGAGDTRSPFLAMLLVNVVNISTSILFVFGPEPIGGWGVTGIAMGTVLAWAVGAVTIVAMLLIGRAPIRLRLHRLRPHSHTLWRIIRVGVPNLIESSGMWLGNAVIARWVGGLASEGMLGAHIIAIRVESLAFLPAVAIGMAASTLTGQYLGLGDAERARRSGMLCWGITSAIMIVMGVVFILFAEPLARVMAPDEPALYEAAAPLIRLCGPFQIFFGTHIILSHALRGAGDTTTAMGLTYLSTFLVRLPLVWVLGVEMGMGLWGVWIGLCAELVVRGLLFAWRFLHGGWTRVRV